MLNFSFDGLSVACTCFVKLECDKLHMGSYFETLLNQGLVMANDTCEATITKRLARWSVSYTHLTLPTIYSV